MRRSQARSLTAGTTKSSTAGSSPNTGEETDARTKRNGNSQGSTNSNTSFVLPSESLPEPIGQEDGPSANTKQSSLNKANEPVVEASNIEQPQDPDESDTNDEGIEPTLVINRAVSNVLRAPDVVEQSSVVESSVANNGEDSTSVDSFFRSVVTMAGLLIDNPAVRGAERSNRFLQGLEVYLGDEIWLRRMLLPIRLGSLVDASRVSSGPNLEPSLIRVLLRIECIQTKVIERLLEIFAARALDVQSDVIDEEVDMVLKKILTVLSWLDFVSDPRCLAEQFLQTLMVLNDAKSVYLREAIQFLPEILPDSEHPQAVEALLKMFKESRSDTACILDAMSNLTLPTQFIQELLDSVLGSLHSAPKDDVPVLVRFLLATCAQSQDSVVIESTLRELRSRLLFLNEQKTSAHKSKSTSTNSGSSSSFKRDEEKNAAATVTSMVVREIQRAFLLHRPLWSCYLNMVLKHHFHGEFVFLDVWILLSLSRSTQYASIAREGLKRIALSVDGEKVFEDAIANHGATIEPFVGELLEISGSFLRVGHLQKQADRYRSFGARILFLLFEELDELGTLQEVMLCMASHCSQPNKPEVDAVLECLNRICSSKRGANKLNHFSSYVKSLLNHLERYDIVQARMVFQTVARVCLAGEHGSDDDELRILLRKLLGCADNSKPQILGIIGTCQLVSVLAPVVPQSRTTTEDDGPVSYAKVQDAITLIDQMLKSTSSPFKFDEIARLIEHEKLDDRAVNALSSMAMDAFEEFYLFDSLPSRMMKLAAESKLVVRNQFGIVANEDEMEESASIVARIYSLVRDSLTGDVRRRHRLEQMASMSRLVMACLLKSVLTTPNNNNNNESPDEDSVPFNMLECPFELPLIPESSSTTTTEEDDNRVLTVIDKQALVLSYFYACEWMRESINSFSRLLSSLPASSKTLKKSLERSLTKRMDLLVECNQTFHTLLGEYFFLVSLPPTSSSIVLSLGMNQPTARAGLKKTTTSAASSKAKKKNSKTKSKEENNVEEEEEEEHEEEALSSSEDDAIDEEEEGEAGMDQQPKQKKARLASKQRKTIVEKEEDILNGEPNRPSFLEEENENDDAEAEEEEENHSTTSNIHLTKTMRPTKEKRKKTNHDNVAQQSAMKEAWMSAQRLLSPLCLLLMASNNGGGNKLCPQAIQMILTSSLAHFEAHFGGSNIKNKSILYRSEFDSQELKQFVLMNNCVLLKSLRRFTESICGEIELDPSQEEMKLKVTCVDLIIQLLSLLVSSEISTTTTTSMNESSKQQPPFILSVLRGFATPEEEREQLSRSTTTLQASLTRDEASRVDCSDLISTAVDYLFDFLSDSISLRGVVFATNLDAQVRVLELLVLLISHQTSHHQKRLSRSLGKLAATLCGREWDNNNGGSSSQFMKGIGRMVEIGLYYSFGLGNPHSSEVVQGGKQQEQQQDEEDEDEEEENVNEENSTLLGRFIKAMSLRNLNESAADETEDFPSLTEKTLAVFYTACLSYLGKWKGKMKNIYRLRFAMTCFAHLILITQSREDVKLFKPALKFGKMFLDSLQKNHHMKLLSDNLRTNRELSVGILRTLQKATRQINNLLTHGKSKKDASMLSLAPGMRKSLESILLSCKRIMKENDVGDMFVVSFLKARNVDGSLFERKEEEDEEEA